MSKLTIEAMKTWKGQMRVRTIIFAAALSMFSLTGPANANDGFAHAYPSAHSWSGFYLGGSIGYGDMNAEFDHDLFVAAFGYDATTSSDINADGVTGTVTLGYDYEIRTGWVLGAFVDYTFGELEGEGTKFYPDPIVDSFKLSYDNIWAVGGRLGYSWNGATLWYASVGYTAADLDFRDGFGKIEKNLDGYFVGGGVEHKIRDGLALSLEYRFSDFGSDTLYNDSDLPCCSERFDLDHQMHAIRLGLTYKFGAREPAYIPPLK